MVVPQDTSNDLEMVPAALPFPTVTRRLHLFFLALVHLACEMIPSVRSQLVSMPLFADL